MISFFKNIFSYIYSFLKPQKLELKPLLKEPKVVKTYKLECWLCKGLTKFTPEEGQTELRMDCSRCGMENFASIKK